MTRSFPSRLTLPLAKLPSAALALATLALAAPTARAQTVVFDNGGPDTVEGFASDRDRPEFSAETFTFGSATSFDTVQWFGSYAFSNTPPATDAFTITFYNTTGGTPDTNPLFTFTVGNDVNRTPTGLTGGSISIFQYTSRLPNALTLGPGTYGIGIVNDTASDPDDNWYWETSNQTGTNFFRFNESNPYQQSSGGDLSFRLINSGQVAVIPEPSEWATGGVIAGTLLLGMVRARRRKAVAKAA